MKRIVHFLWQQTPRWGLVHDDEVRLLAGDYAETKDLLLRGRVEIDDVAAARPSSPIPLDAVLAPGVLLSPVTRGQRFVCQAVNYGAHALEAGLGPHGLGANVVFTKASSSLNGAHEPIVRPEGVQLLDYEIELGLVLGRALSAGDTVTDANLHEFVAGLVVVDDVSARCQQIREGQFHKSKSHRSFGPVGPFLVLVDADELGRWPELELRLSVNGEERQRGLAGDMLHAPAQTLSELSTVFDLDAGDLLATGTPSGVALRVPHRAAVRLAGLLPDAWRNAAFLRSQRRSPGYLREGDLVEATIVSRDGGLDLGRQRTRVRGA
jgi:2,4-diketo-3-deoxy-L-fuconate hydrolase